MSASAAEVAAIVMVVSMAMLVNAQQPAFPNIPGIPGFPGIPGMNPNPSGSGSGVPGFPGIPGMNPSPTTSASSCNFKYMLSKYNGCQSYVLTGKGANLQEECCSPMANVAHECGCVPMLRPFANSLLGICNSSPCAN